MSRLDTKKQKISRYFKVFTLVIFIIIVTFVAFNRYKYVLAETTAELSNKVISYHLESFKNFSKIAIALADGNFIEKTSSDVLFQKNLESMLQIMRTSTIQNLFVIYREDDKSYSFLLDSEKNPENHAEMFQPFEPASTVWEDCYKTDSLHIYEHQNNTNLWITVSIPLIENNKTVALLGADISYILDEDIEMQLKHFGELFLWFSLAGISWFILLYILVLYFRRKYHEGYIDPLTETLNRHYFYNILLSNLAKEYQFIMIDIDYFKKVNDTYGHIVGDEILKIVAKRIKETIRDDDVLIRFGGEEFLLYTRHLDKDSSFEYAQRIRKSIADFPIYYDDIVFNITISLGVNPYANNSLQYKDMLALADEALYKSKSLGRNRVSISSKPLNAD